MKTQMKTINKRDSSIEILRIIAMLMIILHHYTVYSGADKLYLLNNGFYFNTYLLQIATLGELGVNIFVLILGYYSVENSFSVKKVLKLEIQVIFYSIMGYILLGNSFSLKELLQNFMPLLFNKYWFYSVYMIIYMISPFINSALRAMSRRGHFYIGAIMFLIWSIIPSFTLQNMYVNEVLWFLMLYVIAAYIRLYPDCKIHDKTRGGMMFGISFSIILLITALFDILKDVWCFADYQTYFFSGKTVFAMIAAIGLFILFLNMKPFYNGIINALGACTFGVYLIHDNNYVRSLLWDKIFSNIQYAETNNLVFHILGSVIVIYIVCTLIEYLRMSFIEKRYLKVIAKIDTVLNIGAVV